MQIKKTVFNDNLRTPDTYTVECAGRSATFDRGKEKELGAWVMAIWETELIASEARIYYNIGWDCDHVLYAAYNRS